jgi:hypothetical protein
LQAARIRREEKLEKEDPRPPLEDTIADISSEPPAPRLVAQPQRRQPDTHKIGFVSHVSLANPPRSEPRPQEAVLLH